jgi:hypothetical protein
MATRGEKHERLHDFLRDSFKPAELQRFLKLKGFAEVAQAVDRNVGGTEYFFDVVEALDQRGLVDAQFFDRLAKARPKKKPQVEGLEAFWIGQDRSEELAEQVRSATTLVELVWCIGKAVVQAGYEKDQADRACARYLEKYKQRHAQVKILGMAEPVPLPDAPLVLPFPAPAVIDESPRPALPRRDGPLQLRIPSFGDERNREHRIRRTDLGSLLGYQMIPRPGVVVQDLDVQVDVMAPPRIQKQRRVGTRHCPTLFERKRPDLSARQPHEIDLVRSGMPTTNCIVVVKRSGPGSRSA